MAEYATSYEFSDPTKIPTIDGQEFPWYVAIEGPMVEAQPETCGATHILWIPVLVDGPMPTPRAGRPQGDTVSVVDGLGSPLREVEV